MAKNSLAELLARDPWGQQATTPLANALATYGKKPDQNFLAKLLGEPIGAVERWGHRGANMRQDGLDLINASMEPGVGQLQGLGMAALGAGMIPASPFLSLLPSSQELRDRGRAAGGGDLNQAIGGAIGDLVNIPDPATSATALATIGKAALTAKGLAAAAPILGKSAAVAPLGKGLAELLASATPAEQLALKARLEAEAAQTGGVASGVSREQALNGLTGNAPIPSDLPDTWYHGSPADIYGPDGSGQFRLTAGETGVPAIWASSDPFSAEGYSRGEMALNYDDATGRFPLTKSWYKDWDGNGGVYGLKSAAKNPLVHDAGGKQWSNVQQGKIMREAKAKGHDAVIFRNIADNYQSGGPSSDVIAFMDTQAIKPDRK